MDFKKRQYALYLSESLVNLVKEKYPAMVGNVSACLNQFMLENLAPEQKLTIQNLAEQNSSEQKLT